MGSGVVRFVRRHRRSVAFLLAFVGVLVGLAALRERPPTWEGLVVRADLPAGHTLAADDVIRADLDASAHPTNAVTDPASITGRVLAGPVAAGEVLVEGRIVGPGLLAGAPPGTVAMPLQLDDAAEVAYLRPGDSVDVLAAPRTTGPEGAGATSATTVARDARVLALGGAGDQQSGGLLGGGSTGTRQGAATVVVQLPSNIATLVAGASATSRISVVVRPL